MQTNFKEVVEEWLEKKEIKTLGYWGEHIRDIERELDRGDFDIDEAIDRLEKIQKFPRLERLDIEFIKKNVRK